jgi:calcineurin-like phosphoesterase family protein
MSGRRFYTSDQHLGHRNFLNFLNEEGRQVRPFSSVEEMDEYMIQQWNSVVQPEDTLVSLGDIAIRRKSLQLLERLNGRKILIRGNHDIFSTKDYLKYFDEIRAVEVKQKSGVIFSHYPIHPDSLKKGWINVHGHIHEKEVLADGGIPDYRYFNISVERMNYTPIEWNDLYRIVNERRELQNAIMNLE